MRWKALCKNGDLSRASCYVNALSFREKTFPRLWNRESQESMLGSLEEWPSENCLSRPRRASVPPLFLSPAWLWVSLCFVFNTGEYIHINSYLKDWNKLNCFRKPHGNVIRTGIHDLTFLFPLDEVSKIRKAHVKDGCINGFLFIHNSTTNCFPLPQGHEIGFNMTLQKYS